MTDVHKLIENFNISSEYVIAAISGGPDSMYLLEVLQRFDFKVVVAHVHHNLRKDSDFEAQKVEEYCVKHNLFFEYK